MKKTQTFELEAQFITLPPKLYMGLTGEGNIVIQSKKKRWSFQENTFRREIKLRLKKV